ncbi:MAG: SCP2 sterol-binding domain-containing protein [Anaerolineae bacterium]|nr:SCP2 sterol-binding domain-containing protein [Anaerolineae bacterium]
MATSQEVAEVIAKMTERFNSEKAADLSATLQFDLSGDNGGMYWVKISGGTCETGAGVVENPQMTLKASGDDFYALATGKLNAMQAFMMGKVKVTDVQMGMKMMQIFAL